jgi:competence protein ComEA
MPERSKWQMVAWGVAAVLLVLAAVRMVGPGAGPPSVPVRVDAAGAGGPGGGGTRGSVSGHGVSGEAPGGVYVHVAGEVRRPGLFRVPEGSRAAAAIYRAGGPTDRAELAAVNLAQRLEDGQQVIVPRRGPPGTAGAALPPGAAASGVAGAPGAVPVSLTTATIEQLDQLDGIGPTLAQRIIEFRDQNGGFRSLGQLQEVEGIGEKRFASLQEAVRP